MVFGKTRPWSFQRGPATSRAVSFRWSCAVSASTARRVSAHSRFPASVLTSSMTSFHVPLTFWRFTAFTLLGCIPWVLMLGLIGESVGSNWEDWRDKLHYLDYVVLVAILGGIAYLLIKRRRRQPASA